MKRCALAFSVLLLPLTWAATTEYLSAKKKVELIQSEKLRPGSMLSFSQHELNAWVRGEVPQVAPQGVRDPKIELGHGAATALALIDFVKVRQSTGNPPSWFVTKLLAGERPVRVTARIESSAGKAVVHVDRVEISGILIEGSTLDFLIRNYVNAYYPEAKVGKPFTLEHKIDRLDVQPTAVGVFIRK